MVFRGYACFLYTVTLTLYSLQLVQTNDGTTNFSKDLYLQCIKEKPGNTLISPLSVTNSLVLLTQGAYGVTFEELIHALNLNTDKQVIADEFLKHNEAFVNETGERLEIANKIYIQKGYHLNEHFNCCFKF